MMKVDFIENIDCLQGMKSLPANSIDLTVTSPPYDNLREYNKSSVWNFEKFKEIAKELYRVTNVGGIVVWVVNDATIKGNESGASFKQALYFKEIGFNLHDTMIWHKPNCFNFGSNFCYTQSFEYMFIFAKGKPKTANFIKDIICKNAGKTMKGGRKHSNGVRDKTPNFICAEYKKRHNVWEVNLNSCNNKHPAVFPEQLAHDHIISWSNENDIVLDPFLGSGTTAIEAVKSKRHYIGFEIDSNYFEICCKRLNTIEVK